MKLLNPKEVEHERKVSELRFKKNHLELVIAQGILAEHGFLIYRPPGKTMGFFKKHTQPIMNELEQQKLGRSVAEGRLARHSIEKVGTELAKLKAKKK
jgi:hypothetical protein